MEIASVNAPLPKILWQDSFYNVNEMNSTELISSVKPYQRFYVIWWSRNSVSTPPKLLRPMTSRDHTWKGKWAYSVINWSNVCDCTWLATNKLPRQCPCKVMVSAILAESKIDFNIRQRLPRLQSGCCRRYETPASLIRPRCLRAKIIAHVPRS